jgi:hypothetical protein
MKCIDNLRMWWRRGQRTAEGHPATGTLREHLGGQPIAALRAPGPAAPQQCGCPFYGKSAHPEMRLLIETGGNQCAAIWGRHSPCSMEISGKRPDLSRCPLRWGQSFPARAAAMLNFNQVQGWFEIR